MAGNTKIFIADEYEHPDDNIEYILENVLNTTATDPNDKVFLALEELYNSFLTNPCSCQTGNSQHCQDCFHGGNYVFDENSQELILHENHSKDLIYECSALCECQHNTRRCFNRLVQYGPRKHLKIINSEKYKSKGLITTKYIPKGAFVCEYAGELLTRSEAHRRLKVNEEEHKMNYILCLNEIPLDDDDVTTNSLTTIVDPSVRGNIGRYINHSCAPNCKVYSVRVDCPIPKIAIFAYLDILPGEELSFNYSDGVQKKIKTDKQQQFKDIHCLCDAENCEKYLPNVDF